MTIMRSRLWQWATKTYAYEDKSNRRQCEQREWRSELSDEQEQS